jgi:hypothetical protein
VHYDQCFSATNWHSCKLINSIVHSNIYFAPLTNQVEELVPSNNTAYSVSSLDLPPSPQRQARHAQLVQQLHSASRTAPHVPITSCLPNMSLCLSQRHPTRNRPCSTHDKISSCPISKDAYMELRHCRPQRCSTTSKQDASAQQRCRREASTKPVPLPQPPHSR